MDYDKIKLYFSEAFWLIGAGTMHQERMEENNISFTHLEIYLHAGYLFLLLDAEVSFVDHSIIRVVMLEEFSQMSFGDDI